MMRETEERESNEFIGHFLKLFLGKKIKKTLKIIFCCSLNFLFSLTLFFKNSSQKIMPKTLIYSQGIIFYFEKEKIVSYFGIFIF